MSGLLGGGGSKTPAQKPDYTGLQVQTSANGLPIPIVYGANRVAANLIDYLDFVAVPHTQNQGGGKGGGGSSTGSTTYTYAAAVDLAICEGPVLSVNAVYRDKSFSTPAGFGLTSFLGAAGQAAWGYMTANHPDHALAYPGLCHVAAANYDLGSSATLANHSFEVYGVFAYSVAPHNTIPDADPSQMLADFLTNAQYGVGFPSAQIDTVSLTSGAASYQKYCLASGLLLSPALDSQQAARDTIANWLLLTNSAAVWSGGLLKIIPYGDTALTGNGATYTPNVTPLYDLTDDDFVGDGSAGPVLIMRSDPADAKNHVKVEIKDRTNQYNTTPIEAKDQAAIELYGLLTDDTVTAHEITDPNVGALAAQLILQRGLYIRTTYQFKLSWEYCLLEPMDLVTLTDAALGLSKTAVRITKIEEDESGELTVTAEEFPAGVATATLYPKEARQASSLNYNVAPGSVNAPLIYEAPESATVSDLELWIAASGVNTNWGGCNVWVSQSGTDYEKIASIKGPARQGVLTAALPAVTAALSGQTVDTTHTLAVDLSQSRGSLISGSLADALGLNTLILVDQELMAFQTATLTGTNKYALTTLVRGAYGTTIAAHAAGAPFARLDSAVLKYPFLATDIGSALSFKFTSYNIFGAGEESLASVNATTFTLTGSALAYALGSVTNLTFSYIGGLSQLAWAPIQDLRDVVYEIRSGPTFASAQLIGRTANTNYQLQGGDGIYWVTGFVNPLRGLVVYSPAPASITVAGATLVRNVVQTYDEGALGWRGTISGGLAVTAGTLVTDSTVPFLPITNFLGLADLLYEGAGVNNTGTYTVPASHVANTGRVVASYVTASITAYGQSITTGVLQVSDFLGQLDVLGNALSSNITIQVLIATAGADGVFTAFRNFQPGQYVAQYFKLQLAVTSSNPNTQAIVSGFQWSVDMPDRTDHYNNLTIPAGGLNLVYQPTGAATAAPFQGGPGGAAGTPGLPLIQVTCGAGAAGDVLVITNQTLSGCTLQWLNGGVGAARSNCNITVEGY